MHRHDAAALVCLIVTWLLAVTLVGPIGDFPSNDDWAYAWTVRHLLETGDLQFSDWTATNLLPQALWGALFCLPFGFSFTALRLSTLTLGLLGVIATYGMLREVRATPARSLAAALTVGLNPIYFALSHTFMTDVPSFTFIIVSLYFLTCALQRDSTVAVVVGFAVCLISILNRQTGVILVPAFGTAYLVKYGVRWRTTLTVFLLSVVAIGTYIAYPAWLQLTDRTPYFYDFQTSLLWKSIARSVPDVAATYGQNLVVIVMYSSVFLLPFIMMSGLDFLQSYEIRSRRRTIAGIAGIVLVAATAAWMAKYARMPLIGNVLNLFGIGPTQIAGSLVGLDRHPVLIFRGWQLITAAGVAASVPLFSAVFRATGVARRPSTCSSAAAAALLTAVVAALYILPIATLQAGYWFDRYLLPVLPLLMVLISIGANRSMVSRSIAVGPVVGAALLAFYGVVAVSMTHDYLAWNRTRWQALELLLQETGSPREYVDGGFEFNGWFFGSSIEECNPQRARARHTSDRSWGDFTCIWDRRSAQYFVSPVVGAGNRVEQSHSFTRWFPPGKQQLYVLRRNLDQ